MKVSNTGNRVHSSSCLARLSATGVLLVAWFCAWSFAWAADAVPGPDAEIYPGSGVFVNTTSRSEVTKGKGSYTLNFEKAEIAQVIELVLGKMLQLNYSVDSQVRGQVTMQTSEPLRKEAVLPALETVLKLQGVRIIDQGGLMRVVPDGRRGIQPLVVEGDRRAAGYRYQLIPLRYIAAAEMAKILEPMAEKESVVRIDHQRNLLVLGGTGAELAQLLDTVELFDVDWLAGMSVGMFPIRYADSRTLVDELNTVLLTGKESGRGDVLRIQSLERLNSVLVITPQAHFLDSVKQWIDRLDKPGGGDGIRLYIYEVQNNNAQDLAATLNELFTGEQAKSTQSDQGSSVVAPGMQAVTLSDLNKEAPLSKPAGGSGAQDAAKLPAPGQSAIRIMAAPDNNNLLILAKANDYARIETAVRRLDVMPLQVLVEASIVDVRLSGELSYGMQWYFTDKMQGGEYSASGQVGDALTFPGTFNYSVVNASGVLQGMLRALASEGKVNVLSSPTLMVRNNETANIRVGDQQPISTALVSSEGKVVASSVQFKDTGVMLEVTPRVNSSGLVSLEVNQEVTDVGDIDEATGQRAFLRRSIRSSVAVDSGETIVLGGLIRENKANGESGVPVLTRLPLLGMLFGKTISSSSRTELIIMLTPRVIKNTQEARQVTAEYRKKLENIGNQ